MATHGIMSPFWQRKSNLAHTPCTYTDSNYMDMTSWGRIFLFKCIDFSLNSKAFLTFVQVSPTVK